MYLTYQPEGQEKMTWPFFPNKIRRSEAIEIEKVSGWDFAEFMNHFGNGSMKALGIALWVAQRRVHPQLKYADLPDFTIDEISVVLDKDEIAEARKRAEDEPEDEREKTLAKLDELEKVAVEPEGKAS